MSAVLHLPIDILQLPEFWELAAAGHASSHGEEPGGGTRPTKLGHAGAMFVVFCLFQELGYRAQSGEMIGLFKPEMQASLQRRCAEGIGAQTDVVEALESAKWLSRQGEGTAEVWFCPRFKATNGHLGDVSTQNQRGGYGKAFAKKARAVAHEATQTAMLLLETKLVDETGAALDGDTTKRVIVLIKLADQALGLPDRQNFDFGEALIQNALKVVRRYEDQPLEDTLRRIAIKRGTPRLIGVGTDKLLEQFEEFVREIN